MAGGAYCLPYTDADDDVDDPSPSEIGRIRSVNGPRLVGPAADVVEGAKRLAYTLLLEPPAAVAGLGSSAIGGGGFSADDPGV